MVAVLLNTFTAAVTVNVVSDTNPALLNQTVNFTATLFLQPLPFRTGLLSPSSTVQM